MTVCVSIYIYNHNVHLHFWPIRLVSWNPTWVKSHKNETCLECDSSIPYCSLQFPRTPKSCWFQFDPSSPISSGTIVKGAIVYLGSLFWGLGFHSHKSYLPLHSFKVMRSRTNDLAWNRGNCFLCYCLKIYITFGPDAWFYGMWWNMYTYIAHECCRLQFNVLVDQTFTSLTVGHFT